MKGALEEGVKALDFPRLRILQPGFIERPDSDRLGERLTLPILRSFNGLGMFDNYRPITTAALATALIKSSYIYPEAFRRLALKDLFQLLAS